MSLGLSNNNQERIEDEGRLSTRPRSIVRPCSLPARAPTAERAAPTRRTQDRATCMRGGFAPQAQALGGMRDRLTVCGTGKARLAQIGAGEATHPLRALRLYVPVCFTP
jgi:hypothetical protein